MGSRRKPGRAFEALPLLLLLLLALHQPWSLSAQATVADGAPPSSSSGPGPEPSPREASASCSTLRYQLGEADDTRQQWEDVGVACRIAFERPHADPRLTASVSYTVTKDLLTELFSVIAQHGGGSSSSSGSPMQHRVLGAGGAGDTTAVAATAGAGRARAAAAARASDVRSSSSLRIKAFLGLAQEEMEVLAAALSLCFPRLAMGWQAVDLFSREAENSSSSGSNDGGVEGSSSSSSSSSSGSNDSGGGETEAVEGAVAVAAHAAGSAQQQQASRDCSSPRCTWERMLVPNERPSLETLLQAALAPPPQLGETAAEPGPAAQEQGSWDSWQQAAAAAGHSGSAWLLREQQRQRRQAALGRQQQFIRNKGIGVIAAASEALEQFAESLPPLVGQLLGDFPLWDVLYWAMWYCCPSMMVAYNAIMTLAPGQPLLVLYIATVASLQALSGWRSALRLLWASFHRDEAMLVRQSLATAGVFCYTMPAAMLAAVMLTVGVGLVSGLAVKWLLMALLLVQPLVVLLVRARMWARLEARYLAAQQRSAARQGGAGGGSGGQHQHHGSGGAAAGQRVSSRAAGGSGHRGTAGTPAASGPSRAALHHDGAAALGAAAARPSSRGVAAGPAGGGGSGASLPAMPPGTATASGTVRVTSLSSLPEVHWPPPLDFPQWLEDEPDVPDAFRCPITLTLMREPTSASSGLTYERKAIFQWLQMHRVDPVCQVPLKRHRLTPNLNLRHMVEGWAGAKITEHRLQETKLLEKMLGAKWAGEAADRMGQGKAGGDGSGGEEGPAQGAEQGPGASDVTTD